MFAQAFLAPGVELKTNRGTSTHRPETAATSPRRWPVGTWRLGSAAGGAPPHLLVKSPHYTPGTVRTEPCHRRDQNEGRALQILGSADLSYIYWKKGAPEHRTRPWLRAPGGLGHSGRMGFVLKAARPREPTFDNAWSCSNEVTKTLAQLQSRRAFSSSAIACGALANLEWWSLPHSRGTLKVKTPRSVRDRTQAFGST